MLKKSRRNKGEGKKRVYSGHSVADTARLLSSWSTEGGNQQESEKIPGLFRSENYSSWPK